jgi:sugar O-acyltransferase (sialic acid O-acetyltransferase NeuD family)
METNSVILFGAGGHCKVVMECLRDAGFEVRGIFDSLKEGHWHGKPILGPYKPFLFADAKVIVTIGSNATRERVVNDVSHQFGSAVHTSAIISRSAQIGTGTMILHGAVVQASTVIGNHVIINTRAQADHDCRIGDFVHVGPGAILCGSVTLERLVLVGAGSVVMPGIHIGEGAEVGAGAVVTKTVPARAIVVGCPAEIIRYKN